MQSMIGPSRYSTRATISSSIKGTGSGMPVIRSISSFTCRISFTGVLKRHDIRISMDGRGRCMDNIFIERLWRSVKYEEVYLKSYATLPEARSALNAYFKFYNNERPHQSLENRTPYEVHFPNGTEGDQLKNGVVFLKSVA